MHLKNTMQVAKIFIAGVISLSVGIPASAEREAPPPTLRPDAQRKAELERKTREKRQQAIKNSMDCFISERVLQANKHTSCIYKCPNGKLESENVGPGYQCPPRMNVIQR